MSYSLLSRWMHQTWVWELFCPRERLGTNKLHPFAFFSCRLTAAEKNYEPIKPDALSRQFESQEEEDRSEPIIPRSRVLPGIQWDLDMALRKGQHRQPDPGNGPSGLLFVPNTVRSKVLQ